MQQNSGKAEAVLSLPKNLNLITGIALNLQEDFLLHVFDEINFLIKKN